MPGSVESTSFSVSFTAPGTLTGSIRQYVVEWRKSSSARRGVTAPIGSLVVHPDITDPLEQVKAYLNGATPTIYIAVVNTGLEPGTSFVLTS